MSHNDPQPVTKPAAGAAIWDLVIADMRERDEVGSVKYGVRLRAGDGRKHLIDAYQSCHTPIRLALARGWEKFCALFKWF